MTLTKTELDAQLASLRTAGGVYDVVAYWVEHDNQHIRDLTPNQTEMLHRLGITPDTLTTTTPAALAAGTDPEGGSMSTEDAFMLIVCDACGAAPHCCDRCEPYSCGVVPLLPTPTDQQIDMERRAVVADNGWTEDGEGLTHCTNCPPLELTDEAKAERAREAECYGPTLFDLEGQPS